MTRVGYCLFPRQPRTGLVAAAIVGVAGHNGYASAAGIKVLGTPSS